MPPWPRAYWWLALQLLVTRVAAPPPAFNLTRCDAYAAAIAPAITVEVGVYGSGTVTM